MPPRLWSPGCSLVVTTVYGRVVFSIIQLRLDGRAIQVGRRELTPSGSLSGVVSNKLHTSVSHRETGAQTDIGRSSSDSTKSLVEPTHSNHRCGCALTPTRFSLRRWRDRRLRSGRSLVWERERDDRPAFRTIRKPEIATGSLDDPVDEPEPEPRTVIQLRLVAVQHRPPFGFRNPAPVVADGELESRFALVGDRHGR